MKLLVVYWVVKYDEIWMIGAMIFAALYPLSNNPSLDAWITNLGWRTSFFCCPASLVHTQEFYHLVMSLTRGRRLGQALGMNWMKNAYTPGLCSWVAKERAYKWVGNGSSVRSSLVQQDDRIIRHCHFCHLKMTKIP